MAKKQYALNLQADHKGSFNAYRGSAAAAVAFDRRFGYAARRSAERSR
jgi:hypothetical protein